MHDRCEFLRIYLLNYVINFSCFGFRSLVISNTINDLPSQVCYFRDGIGSGEENGVKLKISVGLV